MTYIKCPRCELNYIRNYDNYCKICLSELKGESSPLDANYCYICGIELDYDEWDICKSCQKVEN